MKKTFYFNKVVETLFSGQVNRLIIPLCYNESMSDDNDILVYSTDRSVPRRKSRGKACKHENLKLKNSDKLNTPMLTVQLERKGRGGKLVTVIIGLQMPRKKKEGLLKQLKTRLGTGGTVTETTLEIQGDHCCPVIDAMASMGYTAKRSGG
jgi:translation initiation factor 1